MAELDVQIKFTLQESDIPTHWYNIVADLKNPPAPVLHLEPVSRSAGRPRAIVSDGPDRQRSRRNAPSRSRTRSATSIASAAFAGIRARRLERALDTTAHIYYKYEAAARPAATSQHAVAQAYYNKAEGIRRLTTETALGNGQRAGVCLRRLWSGMHRVHGQRELPPEAVPSVADPALRRRGVRFAFDSDAVGPENPGR